LARTYLITGFPWNLLGYAVQTSGLRQIASVTGVYGLSFLAVATSALLAWVLLSSTVSEKTESGTRISNFASSAAPFSVLLGWIVLLLLAQWRLVPPPEAKGRGRELALLVQPNVPLDDNAMDAWVPWRDPTQLQNLVQFSEAAVEQFSPHFVVPGLSPAPLDAGLKPGATAHRGREGGAFVPTQKIENLKPKIQDFAAPQIGNRQSAIENSSSPPLLIWAENPAPFFFTRDPIFRNAVENMARETHAFVIVNTIVPLDPQGQQITNTAITVDPEGREVSRYDKIHLVPFGEYVPWWALPGLVHKITPEVGDFVPGSNYHVATSPGGGIGVFICYEAIIPQLARKLVANGADVLVNISNDGWYGDSAAAPQHLEMARLRAIENRRYLLRATNNGLTTVIDPYGRVLEELPRYRRMVMPAHFDYVTRRTFYSAHGDVFAWLSAVVGAFWLVGSPFARCNTRRKRFGN